MEVFALSDEVVVTELKGAELKQYQTEQKIELDRLAQIEADKIAKATAKAVLLEKLGITDDEAKLLLG
jgi:hypothetical protein